jgi:dihydrofolate reductase
MGRIIIDISMSLDGFVAGANDTPEQPLGRNGQGLHAWISTAPPELMQGQGIPEVGAMISGWRTYDLVNGWDGTHPMEDGSHIPVFVMAKTKPEVVPEGQTPFTFVSDGIASLVQQAKAAAGDKNVYVIGGASIIQQLLNAGLADELRLHIAAVFLGDGTHLFSNMASEGIHLKPVHSEVGEGVVHAVYHLS